MTVYDLANSNLLLFYSRNASFVIRRSDTTTLQTGDKFSIKYGSYAAYPIASFTWNIKTNTVVIILDDEKN
jgi:tricorn protease-like protein